MRQLESGWITALAWISEQGCIHFGSSASLNGSLRKSEVLYVASVERRLFQLMMRVVHIMRGRQERCCLNWLEATMKARVLIAAAIALSAMATVGSTFADRPSDEPVAGSTKSRAEVRAELDQARAEGLLMNSGESGYSDEWTRSGAHGVSGSRYSGRTREEVKAETIEYMKTHDSHSDAMYGR
ncbi:MAG: DUF4148 domain-containing protein [Oxalobacteraceae bacterium]